MSREHAGGDAKLLIKFAWPYKPNELYTKYCDIDLPGDCDNSPLGGSVPIGYTFFSIATAAVLAMLTESEHMKVSTKKNTS